MEPDQNANEKRLTRLRASQTETEEHYRAIGVQRGKAWALDEAEFEELARVAEVGDWVVESASYELARALLDEEDPGVDDVYEALENVGAPKLEFAQDVFAEGFFAGAVEVYLRV